MSRGEKSSLALKRFSLRWLNSLESPPDWDMLDRAGLQVVQAPGIRELIGGREAQLRREIVRVLAAERMNLVPAIAIGRAWLVLRIRKRLIAGRVVGRGVDHEAVPAHAAPEQAAHEAALVGIGAALEQSVRLLAERLGHDVDHAGDGLGAVKETLAALEDLNPFHHVRGNGVQRRRAVVQAIADTDAVHQPQDFVGPRSLQGCRDVVERARLRRQEQAGHERLKRLRHVVEAAVLNLRRRNGLHADAAALDQLGQLLFESRRDDADGLDDAGDAKHDRHRHHGGCHGDALRRALESRGLDLHVHGARRYAIERERAVCAGWRRLGSRLGAAQCDERAVDRAALRVCDAALEDGLRECLFTAPRQDKCNKRADRSIACLIAELRLF